MNLVTTEQMREIDRITIEERGIPAKDLMERAGRAIAEGLADLIEPGPVLVLCGKGNNGGDGFVAARYLSQSGFQVTVVPVLGTDGFSAETKAALDELKKENVEIIELPTEENFLPVLVRADAVIDAMLGTGSRPELSSPMDWIVQALNVSHIPILAADMPTGMDADTGETIDLAVKATMTVTIGLPKKGMATANGVLHCGQVRVEPIQFPRELLENPDFRHRTIKLADVAALLPKRPLDGNKGTYGSLTICSGSRMMPGCATIAAIGGLRSGTGLVRMMIPGSINGTVATHVPEVVFVNDAKDSQETLEKISDVQLAEVKENSTAIVIGPGIGQSQEAAEFLKQILTLKDIPTVVDADALNLIAKDPALKSLVHPNCVLTPHPGEAGRLLDKSIKDIQADRWQAADDLREKFGCTVVLKGYGSLVATKEKEVVHIPSGNTALAQGGAGDLLCGVIGGTLAQGCKPQIAAVIGSFVVGMAADVLVRDKSVRGVTILDVADCLPKAYRELEDSLQPINMFLNQLPPASL